MDDCKWSKARYDEIVEKISPFLEKTGYSLNNVDFVPIAGL
jgi:translation elongation factor EF-1alpha